MIPFMSIGKGKTTETVKRSMIARSLGRTEAQTGKTQVIFFFKESETLLYDAVMVDT